MTITREHLELAALAGGIEIEWAADLNGFVHKMPAMCYSPRSMWHPHTDIADAARLAVRLGMNVTMPRHRGDGVAAEGPDGSASITVYRDSVERAYRHAITLCAAEIGRRMKETE